MAVTDPMVSAAWLAERLGDPAVSVFDASWHMPTSGRDPHAEYLAAHIPGARFFDLEVVRDLASPWPHMLPPADQFQAWARAAGVKRDGLVVVYDAHGLFSAARLWWMFRAFGKAETFVLDGGLPAWRAEGRPLASGGPTIAAQGDFTARLEPDWVRSAKQVADNLDTRAARAVDARGRARFAGEAPEPRPGLRSGHIPGSANLPWDEVVDAEGRLRSADDLAARFAAAGVDLARPVWTTCGSGVTAAILALALARLGREPTALYDGSWSEWGALHHLPIETGAAR